MRARADAIPAWPDRAGGTGRFTGRKGSGRRLTLGRPSLELAHERVCAGITSNMFETFVRRLLASSYDGERTAFDAAPIIFDRRRDNDQRGLVQVACFTRPRRVLNSLTSRFPRRISIETNVNSINKRLRVVGSVRLFVLHVIA